MAIKEVETLASKQLRHIAGDPMWANHCEVSKNTLTRAARLIDELAALLNDYVKDDDSIFYQGQTGDEFPTHDESRRMQAVALLDASGIKDHAR